MRLSRPLATIALIFFALLPTRLLTAQQKPESGQTTTSSPVAEEKARVMASLEFEPQDWTTPKDAWLVNKSSEDKWNLWSSDKEAEKRWSKGVVLQGPVVKKDRSSPEEGAPPLHTRITGIPAGRYDVFVKAVRTLAVSLDGKTWRRFEGGLLAGDVQISDGVFELWVDDRYASTPPGPCYYDQVVLTPRPPIVDGVANGRFEFLNAKGEPLAWMVKAHHIHYDAAAKVFKLASPPRQNLLVPPGGDSVSLTQIVRLKPGHYLLQAVARANTQECILLADSLDYRGEGDRKQVLRSPFGVPIGITRELHTVELPFFVEDNQGAECEVTIGVRTQYVVPVHTEIELRQISLTRLGDTELAYHWAEKLPMKPYHGLSTLREHAQWERPGRVIFTDTYTGAEVWLMTQGEKSYLRAQGVHSFSPDGKYLYVKDPGVILRTDASARYTGFRGYPNNEPWLAPWLRTHVPAGENPSDWVLAGPPEPERITLRHIITGRTVEVPLPKKDGWTLALLPGKMSGIFLQCVNHDTLVWVSNDNRRIGLSNSKGERFRIFDVRSISPDPSKDVFMWREKVAWLRGLDGRWYVGYILNWAPFMGGYNPTPENTVNPGQMWALPIAEDDTRGILRVVDGYQYWGMCVCPYKLEDGSVLYWWTATHRAMNAEAGYRIRGTGFSTLALEDIVTAEVRQFIASYPCLDHIDFSHPDFIIPESLLYPYVLLFIDVKRCAMWPIFALQFHDYGAYTAGGGAGLLAQNPSPDVTKIACVSSMLCKTDVATDGPVWRDLQIVGGKRPQTALDVYNVVVRYPQPPVNVHLEGDRIRWDRPAYHKEICGFNLYRSERSGGPFRRVNDRPIESTEYTLPDGTSGYYVLTSVEYSGLESRAFSEELAINTGGVSFRHFYEAENADLTLPMAPIFDTTGCSNAYAVAVQDRDLLYKARLEKGLRGAGKLAARVPAAGPCRLLARVRALKPSRSGRIEFSINGKPVGSVQVTNRKWQWMPVDAAPARLEAGAATIEFASSAVDVALDNILLTNDLAFTPTGKGNAPDAPPSAPSDLRAVKPTEADYSVAPKPKPGEPPYVKLAWTPSSAPQGVHHYNVYRSEKADFEVGPETLLGSPSQPVFFDCGLAEQTYYYRVTALDSWGNESRPSPVFAHHAKPPSIRLKVAVKAPKIGEGDEVLLDASASSAAPERIKTFLWNLGDGATAEGPTVRHSYPRGGRYTILLRAETNSGDIAFQEIPVYVHDPRLQKIPADAVVLVEAESFVAEGGGKSQRLSSRVNASGDVVSYWEKDLGHWLEWNVPIRTAGDYTIMLKYSSGSKEAVRDLLIDGAYPAQACRHLVFSGTGGFSSDSDNWRYATVKDETGVELRIPLTAGSHKLRMANLGGGMAVDFILLLRSP